MSTATNPTPTVGRVVLYVLPPQSKRAGEVRPAIVVRVNSTDPQYGTVNLSVQTDGPNDLVEPNWQGSVKQDQDDKQPGTWHWMPYQMAVAAGTIPAVKHADPEDPIESKRNTVTKERINDLTSRSKWADTRIGQKSTLVCLTLPNGFEIIESSGCVDPLNYDHEIGVKICKERIINRLWTYEGYHLACELESLRKDK